MPPKKSKNTAEPESCSVCLDDYTAILRKKIVCKYCKKDSCCKCIERYLLEKIEDAHCLHCRVNYDDATLRDICTKTYLQNKYYKHRQDILVNRERANLPGLQDQALEERQRRQFQDKMLAIRKEIDQLLQIRDGALIEYNRTYTEYQIAKSNKAKHIDQLFQKVVERSTECEDIRRIIQSKQEEIHQYHVNIYRLANPNNTDESAAAGPETEKKKFIRRCTRDNCQGFLSTAWKCGICEYYSCNKCFTPRGQKPDDPHECRKEDIETADLIRKDSKPCPNCGVFITRSEGCSQMFCISCQTPFDWNTGKIVTSGAIHNPHYYEWLKRNGQANTRNPADVPCGGYPNGWELRRLPRGIDRPLGNKFYEFHRLCIEIQDSSTRNWQTHLTQDAGNKINVHFLLGDYDEKRWGQLLAQLEKKRKRDREVQDIFAAFRMVAVELLNRIQQHQGAYGFIHSAPIPTVVRILQEFNTEANALITMINDAFKTVSYQYNYSVPFIHFDLHGGETRYALLTKNYVKDEKEIKKGKKEELSSAAASAIASSYAQPPVSPYDSDDYDSEDTEEEEEEKEDPPSHESESEDRIIEPPEADTAEEMKALQQAIVNSLSLQ